VIGLLEEAVLRGGAKAECSYFALRYNFVEGSSRASCEEEGMREPTVIQQLPEVVLGGTGKFRTLSIV
jgi:hypothetical protein